MGLSRAADFIVSNPGSNVLIIAVELPSLTFQRKDITQANLISSILFGDGAAAVIVTGQKRPGPQILVTETYTFPDSLGAMGFDLRDSGFHIILDKNVPEMIGERIKELVHGFLDRNGKSAKKSKDGFCIPAEPACWARWKKSSVSASATPSLRGTSSATSATFPAPLSSLFFRSGWRSAL